MKFSSGKSGPYKCHFVILSRRWLVSITTTAFGKHSWREAHARDSKYESSANLFHSSRAVSTIVFFDVFCKLLFLYKWPTFRPVGPHQNQRRHAGNMSCRVKQKEWSYSVSTKKKPSTHPHTNKPVASGTIQRVCFVRPNFRFFVLSASRTKIKRTKSEY